LECNKTRRFVKISKYWYIMYILLWIGKIPKGIGNAKNYHDNFSNKNTNVSQNTP